MMEIGKREKEAGIVPDPDLDTYMKVPVSSCLLFLQVCEVIHTAIG
jgi:hypothetical protein